MDQYVSPEGYKFCDGICDNEHAEEEVTDNDYDDNDYVWYKPRELC